MNKKILFSAGLSALLVLFRLSAIATQITVEAQQDGFHPHSFDVFPGDTIHWVWVAGKHTSTSTSIPQGAMDWNAPLDSAHVTFDYVVIVEGIYNFVCSDHEGVGGKYETGSFTSHLTGIHDQDRQSLLAYPNPFTNELFIESSTGITANTAVMVSDILGKQAANAGIQVTEGKIRIETADLVPGVYLVTLGMGEGKKEKTVRVVKR